MNKLILDAIRALQKQRDNAEWERPFAKYIYEKREFNKIIELSKLKINILRQYQEFHNPQLLVNSLDTLSIQGLRTFQLSYIE